MLDAIRFVKGAVSKKDFVPALSHFLIKANRITGFNGKLSLSAPISMPEDCCPKAETFVRAVEACADTIELHLTKAGKLGIRSGKFKAFVDTVPTEQYPGVAPEGQRVDAHGELLPALAKLYEFSAEDASRPWAAGVLLNGNSAFATNNVVIAECWLGYYFPFRIIVPRYAIKEILRIGEEPTHMRLTRTNATFFYEGERWLSTQLVDAEWPDVERMFAAMPAPNTVPPVAPELFPALETLEPFVDEYMRIYMLGDHVSTALQDGASVELAVPAQGAYNIKMLRLLEGVAQQIAFDMYPAPVPWYGKQIRGLIAGQRV